MTWLYLITGFLGAGKTTLIKNLLPHFKGRSLGMIINEFGKEGVDGKLLKGLGAELSEIAGGSIFCSCRLDRFQEALEKTLEASPEIILVEASGLSDPTKIKSILNPYISSGRLAYKGAICLADASRLEKVFYTARVSSKQLAVSDLVVINKSDLAEESQLEKVRELIRSKVPGAQMVTTALGHFEKSWLDMLKGGVPTEDEPGISGPDITLQKARVVLSTNFSLYELEHFLAAFIEDTCRVKGFMTLKEGVVFVDCVGPSIRIQPWEDSLSGYPPNTLNALATEGMPLRKSLQYARSLYEGRVLTYFGQ